MRWYLSGLCLGVIIVFCTFLFTCLTFLSKLFHPPPFSVLRVEEFSHKENTWSIPSRACDHQQRGAALRPHHLCTGTAVLRAVRMHGRCYLGAPGKAFWRRGMCELSSEWMVPSCGKERKGHTHRVLTTIQSWRQRSK